MRSVAAALLLGLVGCSGDPRRDILVESNRVVVTNLSTARWSNLEVWVNDHYRAVASELQPDQRLDVPLATLVAGFGQRYDPRRQSVYGVEVTASGSDGRPVRLVWGKGRRR